MLQTLKTKWLQLQPKLVSFWQETWTKELAYIKIFGGLLTSIIAYLSTLLSDSGVKTAIDALHLDPKICLLIAILGTMTWVSAEHKSA